MVVQTIRCRYRYKYYLKPSDNNTPSSDILYEDQNRNIRIKNTILDKNQKN